MATGGLLNANTEDISASFKAMSPSSDSNLAHDEEKMTVDDHLTNINNKKSNGTDSIKENGSLNADDSNHQPKSITNGDQSQKSSSTLDKASHKFISKPSVPVKLFKVEIPRIASSKSLRPQRAHSPVTELEQRGLLCNGPGAKRDLNKSILKIRTTELEECVKKAKKYSMEQSVRFALVKQQQQQQKQQLELIKKQQALLLMCRIYVGSIFYEVKEEAVRAAFSHFGPIRSITMSWDQASGKHKGFAFIEFETPEAAALAFEQMNGSQMGGRNIKVGRPSNMPQAQPIIDQLTEDAKTYSRIYVASIHPELNESDVQSVFEAFGTIRSCSLVRDMQTGKHKGYGFIEYETMQATHDAINAMNNFDLGGQLLRVGRAVTPPETSPDKINQTLLMNHLQASGGMVGTAASVTAAAAAAAAASASSINHTPTTTENTPTTASTASSSITPSNSTGSLLPNATKSSTANSTLQPTTPSAPQAAPTQTNNSEMQVLCLTTNKPSTQSAASVVSPSPTQVTQPSNPDSIELTENQKKLLGMTSVDDPQASLEQQVELTLKGKEQRLMLMQKLMRRKPDSRVVVLRNMIGAEDVDDELENEITDECGKYGYVDRVLIYQEQQSEEEDSEILVKIFVEFSNTKGAEQAINALNGRYFAGRVVKAEIYDQEAYDSKDFSG